MRASYLSQDRCDLQFAVKELARRMQQPNTKNVQALKRLVRFLKGSPRCLNVYNRQAEQPILDVREAQPAHHRHQPIPLRDLRRKRP